MEIISILNWRDERLYRDPHTAGRKGRNRKFRLIVLIHLFFSIDNELMIRNWVVNES
jgi:hypothetical protein